MNKFTKRNTSVSLFLGMMAFCLLALGVLSMSQMATATSQVPSTLNRPQDPVVVSASALPAALLGSPTNAPAVFAYDDVTMMWAQIPYQVDDITSGGTYTTTTFDDDGAGVIDTTDEFVFMAGDAGDQLASADACKALTLPCTISTSPTFDFHEIAVTDPLTGEMGWVYVVDSSQTDISCTASTADYVGWDVTTQTATGGYGDEDLTITFGGLQATPFVGIADLSVNSGPDLIDRQKLRLDACVNFLGCTPIVEDEEGFAALAGTALLDVPIDGAVRLAGGTDSTTFVYGSYFDIAVELDPNSFGSPLPITINSLRSSLDFNDPGAVGITNWCDSSGNAYTIDGSADPAPALFDWYLAYGGAAGGLHVSTPNISPGTGTASAYYHDSAPSANPVPDGTTDTGDNDSYSDTGVLITNSGGSVIGFTSSAYVLSSNTSSCAMGPQYDAWINNPLTVAGSATYTVDPAICQPTAVTVTTAQTNGFGPAIPAILLTLGMMLLTTSLAVRRK